MNEVKCKDMIEIRYELFTNQKNAINTRDIESGYVFSKSPFLGRFKIEIDGKDILEGLSSSRRLCPFEYILWLSDNFNNILREAKPNVLTSHWMNNHVISRQLGDHSPNTTIYRNGQNARIDCFDGGSYEVPAGSLGFAIYSAGYDAFDHLNKMNQMKDKEITKRLGLKNIENLRNLKRL